MPAVSPWRATLAGLCAILVGIGIARFAYTPLIPAVIEAGWFTASEAAYLGAANLAGYLAGALFGPRLSAWTTIPVALRGMMTLATASMFACALPLPFLWFFVWRFASGVAGAVLMVLAAPTILSHVPPERRGLAGGVIFVGVGVGIAASGTLVPVFLEWGLTQTWCMLGGIGLLLTLTTWRSWPAEARTADAELGVGGLGRAHLGPRLKALYASYGLNAFGLVPHMVFLVDFVARDLDRGLDAGARYWVLFGIGAMIGPMAAGHFADRIGFGRALLIAFLLQAACVGWLALSDAAIALVVSSLVIGAFVPGISVIALGRAGELLPPAPPIRRAAWSLATTAFAVGQAVASYGFSFLFARGAGYTLLFGLSAAALLLALLIELAASSRAAATSAAES